MSDNVIQTSIWLLFIMPLHIINKCDLTQRSSSLQYLMQVELFAGKMNETTVNVTLNPRLSGVTKVKVHSFPPERCVKTTLWVCFDPKIEKKSVRLHPGIDDQQETSKDIPPREQQQQNNGGGGDSWRVPTADSKLHKIVKRAAAGITASSAAATPRTCKCV